MSLISETIPNLVNGVSQQPSTMRLASQAKEQKNCYSSVVEGLKKRPPTQHIKKIISGTIADAHIHIINRDTTERYVVVMTEGGLRVFDLAGVEKTVNGVDETFTLLSGATGVVNGSTYKIYNLASETSVDFTVSGLGTATVKLQMSTDGVAWSDVDSRTTNGTTAGIAIGSNTYFRAIVSAYAAGTITATVTYKHARYLESATPSQSFRAITIADYTFIVNKEKTVAMDAATTPAATSQALVYVKQGNYSTNYNISVNGGATAGYTTSDTIISEIRTDNIADQLATAAAASLGAGWTVTRQGSTIRIVKDNGAAFSCKATDSNGDRNMVVVTNSIQRFSDLPNVAPADYVVHVQGDLTSEDDDYYVKFVPQNAGATFDRGYWIETRAPGIQYKLDGSTMPYTLARQGDGTFLWQKATWSEREVGDATSSPDPSFVGLKINDVFFFKNRLGFLADENYILSRSGSYFSFFRETTTAVLDSDPIDAAVSHTKVSILRAAVQASKKLFLYADQTQFEVDGGNLLTPKEISSNVSTEFENSKMCRPLSVGKNVYFVVQKGNYSGLREYYVDDNTATADAANVTAHVPSYIPKDVYKIASATNEDILVLFSSSDRTRAWAYKFYWNGDEKLQSSWSKFEFGDNVLSGDFIETDLYLVMQRADGVYIEKVSVEPFREDTGFQYEILLDRKITEAECTSVVYDAANDWTTWTLPYSEANALKIVTRSGGAAKLGVAYTHTRPSNTTIRVAGDKSAQPVYIGKTYTASYTLSEPVLKASRGEGKGESPIRSGRLQILRYRLAYDRTGYFKITVSLTDGQTYEYKFTGKTLGSGQTTIGVSGLEHGDFGFPVRSRSDRFEATIESDSFMPFHIQSAEWYAQFVLHAQRA